MCRLGSAGGHAAGGSVEPGVGRRLPLGALPGELKAAPPADAAKYCQSTSFKYGSVELA